MAKTTQKPAKEKKAIGPAARVLTLNLHRVLKDYHGKHRAPRAIRELKKLATKEMGTEKVLISPSLNFGLWKKGIRNIPNKLRVRIVRKADESEENAGGFLSEVELVQVPSFAGLVTEKEQA